MINGVHALIYTPQAETLRAFFRDVLKLPNVDAGGGWLIFALPPAELGIHPADDGAAGGDHKLALMCDDVHETLKALESRGVEFAGPVSDRGYGLVATIKLPGGGAVDLYEPRHPVALGLGSR